jgi:ribosome modulation factor
MTAPKSTPDLAEQFADTPSQERARMRAYNAFLAGRAREPRPSEAPMGEAHTPGPWAAVVRDHGPEGLYMDIVGRDGGTLVCSIAGVTHHSPSDPHEENYANTCLIWAAPDLLAALQYVMAAHGEQLHDAFDQALAAIARATGSAA